MSALVQGVPNAQHDHPMRPAEAAEVQHYNSSAFNLLMDQMPMTDDADRSGTRLLPSESLRQPPAAMQPDDRDQVHLRLLTLSCMRYRMNK